MTLPTPADPKVAKALGPLPAGHPPVKAGKIGVMLVNLGTPDGTDFKPMWRYLREFLSDPRVIELNRAIWYPILYGLVLTTRPKKSGANYARIWNREKNESPLRTYTRAQAEKLAEALRDLPDVVVDWAMRYGNPSTASIAQRLADQGCDRILSFPLYPQYSATTTATANDQLFRALMKMRRAPAVRSVPPYYDEPVYIEALARSIERHLATLDFEPEVVITSYHGIPKPYFEKGDPYHCHCQKTTRLLRERLGWDDKKLIITFQSRFGAQEWLQPYTDKTVEKLAQDGVKSIAVVNPGFSVDCIETLDEIGREAAETFHHAGGKNFAHIPCLNDSAEGMAVIEAMVRRELSGWV
ncbi:ferrochelatase [Mesorhizobium sp. M7A.F.Ca.US.006.04.2.1]|uniref:ferrochelatase n=1 Tax=unclassified Mesorhizobium TaxID=325217 RepID=UPI0004846838|nr:MULTISPECIES: ferrochelatase [unclassified Mesorhizobium]RUX72989.1 ferrochelatase [Mesorhizobium sp. M7A.F.Ca.US.005.03.1.1]RUY14076.1 ferrochelatase [Mesorhizobium sp. M7A.F.Ca.US.005.03.2.1]RUY26339.1 ferrochelatase [Mesorhizobium sp. M7A.F.Ca.US.001.04.2.1]RUY37193.1 ferrochelatase [Mesorhizobium sp. M7A.F.Ca.US.001.04.1.1]RUZ98893.1 ferrochelatase [Mesorhizobium sp. M7A.F.Ca.US.001.02.1.1]